MLNFAFVQPVRACAENGAVRAVLPEVRGFIALVKDTADQPDRP